MKALITKRKNPKVTTVIGMVRMVRIGFTIVFKNASTTATNTVVIKSSTEIPGINLATVKTAKADTIILRIKLMW